MVMVNTYITVIIYNYTKYINYIYYSLLFTIIHIHSLPPLFPGFTIMFFLQHIQWIGIHILSCPAPSFHSISQTFLGCGNPWKSDSVDQFGFESMSKAHVFYKQAFYSPDIFPNQLDSFVKGCHSVLTAWNCDPVTADTEAPPPPLGPGKWMKKVNI